MSSKNGLLNNAQRKALEGQLKVIYERKINDARKHNEALQEQIQDEVRNKLGYKIIKQKIQQLEDQQKLLEKQLEEIGFDSNGNLLTTWDRKSDAYIPLNSKAFKLLGTTLDSRNGEAGALEKELSTKTVKLWMVTEVEEVKKLLEGVC